MGGRGDSECPIERPHERNERQTYQLIGTHFGTRREQWSGLARTSAKVQRLRMNQKDMARLCLLEEAVEHVLRNCKDMEMVAWLGTAVGLLEPIIVDPELAKLLEIGWNRKREQMGPPSPSGDV